MTGRAGGTPTPVLSLRSAAFGYGERAAVSDVTLDVQPGEVVALLGPNGSGKSTLVRGLLGLNDHLGGQVSMFGTPIVDFQEHARLGYVPQRHTLSASVRAPSRRSSRSAGCRPNQPWWGSRPMATTSSTVARTDAERVCRCGT